MNAVPLRKNYINIKPVFFPQLDSNRKYIKFQEPKTLGPRYFIQCDEQVRDNFGNKCWCNMKPQRADRFIGWLEKNNHTCYPGEIVNQRTIDETLASKNSKITQITQEKIHKEIANR